MTPTLFQSTPHSHRHSMRLLLQNIQGPGVECDSGKKKQLKGVGVVSERRKVKKGDWRAREDLLPMWTKFYTNRKSPWEKWIDILHYVQRADSSTCTDINHKFFLAVLFILGAISRGSIWLRTWDTGRKFRGTSSGQGEPAGWRPYFFRPDFNQTESCFADWIVLHFLGL